MAWAKGRRKRISPSLAKKVVRGKLCSCDGCEACDPSGCWREAEEADHLVPVAEGGGVERNLRPICSECHRLKSRAEALRGRQRRANRGRVRESHPGLINFLTGGMIPSPGVRIHLAALSLVPPSFTQKLMNWGVENHDGS